MNSHGQQSTKHFALMDPGLKFARVGQSSFCVHGGANFTGQDPVIQAPHRVCQFVYMAIEAEQSPYSSILLPPDRQFAIHPPVEGLQLGPEGPEA
jgi:hypothetical protein